MSGLVLVGWAARQRPVRLAEVPAYVLQSRRERALTIQSAAASWLDKLRGDVRNAYEMLLMTCRMRRVASLSSTFRGSEGFDSGALGAREPLWCWWNSGSKGLACTATETMAMGDGRRLGLSTLDGRWT